MSTLRPTILAANLWSMEVEVLTEVVRWTGVGIALVASFLAVPGAVRHYSAVGAQHAQAIAARLTRREPPITGAMGAVLPHVEVSASGLVTRNPAPELDLGPRLAVIEHGVDLLNAAVISLAGETTKAKHEIRAEIAEVSGRLTTDLRDLRTRLDVEEQAEVRVNGRVLPLVGLGIVLSGVPDAIAEAPAVAVGLLTLALGLTTWAADLFVAEWTRQHREARQVAKQTDG